LVKKERKEEKMKTYSEREYEGRRGKERDR